MGLATVLLVELVERPEYHCRGIEEDGEQGQPRQESGEGDGQHVGAVAQVQQDGHGCQDEADGIHSHTPFQGRLVLVQVSVDDEGKDDAGHESLNHFEQAWHSGHVARDLAGPGPGPGHLSGISHTSDAGEDDGSNGMVPCATRRRELDVGGGVDDGGREAEKGGIAGVGDGEVAPG